MHLHLHQPIRERQEQSEVSRFLHRSHAKHNPLQSQLSFGHQAQEWPWVKLIRLLPELVVIGHPFHSNQGLDRKIATTGLLLRRCVHPGQYFEEDASTVLHRTSMEVNHRPILVRNTVVEILTRKYCCLFRLPKRRGLQTKKR